MTTIVIVLLLAIILLLVGVNFNGLLFVLVLGLMLIAAAHWLPR